MIELRALTSLRAFAAGMIVIQHLGGRWGAPALPGWNLSAGVSIFFVLSGFILAYRYPTLDTWRERRRFWLKRFARIWPAHAVATLLVLLIVPGAITDLSPGWMLAAIAENLAMVQSWTPVPLLNYSINGPSWSISTEFFFYLMFPALILNFARSWWWKAALSLIIVAHMIMLYSFLSPATDPNRPLYLYIMLYYYPVTRIFEFIVGMIAAFAWMRWRERIELSLVTCTLIEAALVACLIVLLAYTRAWLPSTPGAYEAARTWVQMSVSTVIPATALIVMVALRRGLISVVLSWWPLVVLGELSYSIYLLHMPLLRSHYFEAIPPALALTVFLAVLLALSAAVFWLIERPARMAITGASASRAPASSAPQPQPSCALPPTLPGQPHSAPSAPARA